MDTTPNQANMLWYNYGTVENLMTAPVQVEVSNMDIARQINQQIQYGNIQTVQGPQQQIIVTTQQAPQDHEMDPLSQSTLVSPVVPKSRSRPLNGERVPCQDCGKTFSCNANLRDHMRLHTGERPFTCNECGLSFAQRSNWRLHKRVHNGERPYMCGICGKTFSRSSHLPGHMRVHTKERPFSCARCSQSFASHQALKNHTRTHTGEKPFLCKFCDTAFTHSSSLSSHKKRCTGQKRKRGRPLGSGRKSYKKKSSGRPRGRPKKKPRGGRPKKKILIESNEEIDENVPIKAELITDDDFQNIHQNTSEVSIDGSSVNMEENAIHTNLITPEIIISSNTLGPELMMESDGKMCPNIIMMGDRQLSEHVILDAVTEAGIKQESDKINQNKRKRIINVYEGDHNPCEIKTNSQVLDPSQILMKAANSIELHDDMSNGLDDHPGCYTNSKICITADNKFFIQADSDTMLKNGDVLTTDDINHHKTDNLTQEAAVAMAALQQGTNGGLVQQISYLPRTSDNTIWYSKTNF